MAGEAAEAPNKRLVDENKREGNRRDDENYEYPI